MAAEKEKGFEETFAELEMAVERLESGNLPLEESLATFERGIALVRDLTARLDEAQRRVDVLLRDEDSGELRVHDADEDDAQ
jgi:exodeoxyribonuclease VII small subunit